MANGLGPPAEMNSAGVVKPRWLGRYEVLEEIAQGGMATVYLGRARGAANFERLVAVKVCLPHLRSDEEFAGMFLDEARLAARIHHPNVVATLDVGDEEALYLVMEYIEGDKLSTLIKRASIKRERIPIAVTARIMIDALSGLHAAHELKDSLGEPLRLVHRDVSPHNVLVGVDGIARISDFGIAKAEARATVTREGSLKGKMSYMAPEQLAGKPVDRRADIYAAGVVLWECLAGRRLFRADSEVETFNLVLQNRIQRPSELWPEVPPELDAVVLRALSLDPDKRFATAAEFAEALEDLPFKIAPARAVAGSVEELLRDVLAQRRDIVRSLDDGSPPPEPGAFKATHNGPATLPPGVLTVPRGAPPLPVSASVPTHTLDPIATPVPSPERRRSPLIYAALAALVAVLLVGGVLSMRRAPPPERLGVRPPPPAEPVRLPVAVPEPPPEPPPMALANPDLTEDAGAPVAAGAGEPVAPQAVPSTGERRRPRGARRGADGATPPAASTNTNAPSEFRPGSI